MRNTNNGDKIFRETVTRELRQTPWRRDDLDQEVEHGLHTGTEQERVAGYEDLTVAGYEDIVGKEKFTSVGKSGKDVDGRPT